MQSIFLPVLNPTTIDGQEITEEWIKKYGPTLRGKPVNIDHNYYSNGNLAVGDVVDVYFNPEGNLYAHIRIFDEIYWRLVDNGIKIKGVSFEFNDDGVGEEGIMKGLALCLESDPKVDFARLVEGNYVLEVLASIKRDSMDTKTQEKTEPKKIKDMTEEEFEKFLHEKIEQILASHKKENEDKDKSDNEDDKVVEILASKMDELVAVNKSVLKQLEEIRKAQKEILASAPVPPSGSGNSGHRRANLGL
ncbi:hypothetical protein MJ_0335 [Methanocaldococcus jannaschii DSM 2661]|uniref:Uncharacterized protein MJ0335 n=1 Tax=Methanocaldococcus jannaschii (strain ATCC 43067 / DSM 2661 / JAL-1 / JCM 10045 / NBRC 100440) TaxID=243232 RepID=Y335_METJA|nr:hypothetical protein [Methanocaldococcus jannaschii]Q57781.1 RecName: Full=Uncharacterized protein MJ0335 [Methanocaldococcus jannaschii DSM 2661]AAB98323.1 hypothetical protein MJ_0335 [Methanocaldococcus jannaschii DSM 2661]